MRGLQAEARSFPRVCRNGCRYICRRSQGEPSLAWTAIYCQSCGDTLIMQTIPRDKEMQKRDELLQRLSEKLAESTKRLEELEKRLREKG